MPIKPAPVGWQARGGHGQAAVSQQPGSVSQHSAAQFIGLTGATAIESGAKAKEASRAKRAAAFITSNLGAEAGGVKWCAVCKVSRQASRSSGP